MSKYITLLVFAPYGEASDNVNKEENVKLALEVEGGVYGNDYYSGPGITVIERARRLVKFVREERGDGILQTHSFWRARMPREEYLKSGVVSQEDINELVYHPECLFLK